MIITTQLFFSLGDARLFHKHLLVYLGIKGVLMNFDYPKVLQSVPQAQAALNLTFFAQSCHMCEPNDFKREVSDSQSF